MMRAASTTPVAMRLATFWNPSISVCSSIASTLSFSSFLDKRSKIRFTLAGSSCASSLASITEEKRLPGDRLFISRRRVISAAFSRIA